MTQTSRLLLLILCITLFYITIPISARRHLKETYYQQQFALFIKNFKRIYNSGELLTRFGIFKLNLEYINDYNEGNHAVHLAIGPHTDLTNDEFRAARLGYRHDKLNNNVCMTELYEHIDPAYELNWNARGAVTSVKDQLSCGGCYAFAATAAIEGAWFIHRDQLISLSEQQLIDCSATNGCSGGWYTQSFEYVMNNGICSDADYSYIGQVGAYCLSGMCSPAATLSAWSCVQPFNQSALVQASNLGPISIAISASSSQFQHYSSGILTDIDCDGETNHAVTIVGYNQDRSTGIKYWIIRNSWSSAWGLGGYGYVAFDSPLCGILTAPAFPIV